MKKLSIITVCLNCQSEIQRTMNSIFEQTERESIEHILIDGGSIDSTVIIAKKYKPEVIISEKDNGIYDAMNKGIKYAKSKYCIFLNAGDVLASPDTVRMLLSKFDSQPESLFVGFHGVLRTGKPPKFVMSSKISKCVMNFSHQAVVAPTRVLQEHPFNTNYRYASDFDQLLKIIKLVDVIYIEKVVSLVSPGGVSDINRFRVLSEWIKIAGFQIPHIFLAIRYIAKNTLLTLLALVCLK